MPESAPLLQRHRIFASRCVEQATGFLRSKEFRLDLARRDRPALDVQINGAYLPGMFIGCIGYGAPVTVHSTPARDDFWIQLPLRGTIETTTGAVRVECDATRAAVCPPLQENRLRSSAGSARLNVSLTRAALLQQLAMLLGDEAPGALAFEPVLDVGAGYGASLMRQLLFAAHELDAPGSALAHPHTQARLQELLIGGLLLSHPHSASAALARLERPLAPRDVKRAIDFIVAHLGDALTLADIVAHARVPGRTLFKHFRDVHGVSPMRFVKNARLAAVRAALATAADGQTVAALALRHGFVHLGRFAIDYRRRFGEAPSRTLARARRLH